MLLIEQATLTAGLIVTGNAFALLVVGVILSILESVLNIHGNPLNDFKKSGALMIYIKWAILLFCIYIVSVCIDNYIM